jgi:hypothetical protein
VRQPVNAGEWLAPDCHMGAGFGSFIGAALFAGGLQQKVEGPRLGDL